MEKNKFNKTYTYIGIVLLIAMVIVFIAACASTGYDKSGGMELVYETDFSTDDGAFEYGTGEINEIQKGILHLKKGTSDEPAWIGFERVYGNNSTTTFRIKFGDPVFAHINFLQKEGDRLLLHFSNTNLSFILFLDSREISEDYINVNLTSGSWYEVAVSIADYNLTVSIDSVEIGIVAVDKRLPLEGNMSFECHEEYWVDDLRIIPKP